MTARELIALVAMFAFLFILAYTTVARADCTCECVNGHMQPLCDSSIDLPPICPPTICPIAPPSITPISPPTGATRGNDLLRARTRL